MGFYLLSVQTDRSSVIAASLKTGTRRASRGPVPRGNTILRLHSPPGDRPVAATSPAGIARGSSTAVAMIGT